LLCEVFGEGRGWGGRTLRVGWWGGGAGNFGGANRTNTIRIFEGALIGGYLDVVATCISTINRSNFPIHLPPASNNLKPVYTPP
jgi:hypothetical protein